LTLLTKPGLRGIKPVKHVWLEGINPVFIRDTVMLDRLLYDTELWHGTFDYHKEKVD